MFYSADTHMFDGDAVEREGVRERVEKGRRVLGENLQSGVGRGGIVHLNLDGVEHGRRTLLQLCEPRHYHLIDPVFG